MFKITKPFNSLRGFTGAPLSGGEGGFTLIELMVSVVIFSVIMAIVSGIFVSSLRIQRRTLVTQTILDQTSYLIEYMGRSIRMAVKDVDADCLTITNLNYEKTSSGEGGIRFKSYRGDCQEFFREWDNSAGVYRLKEKESNLYLTSADVNVASFNIGPEQSWQQPPLDYNQPRVTLFLELHSREGLQPAIRLQTTISQRNLDIQK